MRFVLDTNVLLSACWKPEGLEARVVHLALQGQCTACVSPQIWAEYGDVLNRQKFAALHARTTVLLESLKPLVCFVEPQIRADAASDASDNCFLECAAAAGAAVLITGNLKHFPAQWGAIRVMNARQFLTEFPAYLAA